MVENTPPGQIKSLRGRFQKRVAEDGWLTTLTFLPSLLFSAILYVLDIGSDIWLAVQYFTEGDLWWGSLTVAFIVVPWIVSWVLPFCAWTNDPNSKVRNNKEENFFHIASFVNLVPVAALAVSARDFWRGKIADAEEEKLGAELLRLIEIFFEAAPQASLQLYVLARKNRLDALLIAAIVTSLLSVAYGLTKGVVAALIRYEKVPQNNTFLPTLIFSPLYFTSTVIFIPSLAFFSAMESPIYIIFSFLIVFNIYLPICSYMHFKVELHRAEFLYWMPDPDDYPIVVKSSKIIFPFLLSLAVIWFSTCWIVSLAPFLPVSSSNNLPQFLWPNPILPFNNWLIDDTVFFNETWAVCGISNLSSSSSTSSSSSSSSASSSSEPFSPTDSLLSSSNSSLFARLRSYEVCLTDFAVTWYFFFVVGSIFLFVYHSFLAFKIDKWTKKGGWWMEDKQGCLSVLYDRVMSAPGRGSPCVCKIVMDREFKHRCSCACSCVCSCSCSKICVEMKMEDHEKDDYICVEPTGKDGYRCVGLSYKKRVSSQVSLSLPSCWVSIEAMDHEENSQSEPSGADNHNIRIENGVIQPSKTVTEFETDSIPCDEDDKQQLNNPLLVIADVYSSPSTGVAGEENAATSSQVAETDLSQNSANNADDIILLYYFISQSEQSGTDNHDIGIDAIEPPRPQFPSARPSPPPPPPSPASSLIPFSAHASFDSLDAEIQALFDDSSVGSFEDSTLDSFDFPVSSPIPFSAHPSFDSLDAEIQAFFDDSVDISLPPS